MTAEAEGLMLGNMTRAEVERRLLAGDLNEEILVAFKAHLLHPPGENEIQPLLGRLCDLAIAGFRAQAICPKCGIDRRVGVCQRPMEGCPPLSQTPRMSEACKHGIRWPHECGECEQELSTRLDGMDRRRRNVGPSGPERRVTNGSVRDAAARRASLKALSDAATPGQISLNPKNRLCVRTSMDHPMCEFSEPFHRQFNGGEGKDPEFMVALWNAYRAGELT